jgi:hypothetical protein
MAQTTTTDDNGADAFQAGVNQASYSPDDPRTQEQQTQAAADVSKWFKDIGQARKFDEQARINYALDRRYLRGARGMYGVEVPLAPSYVDTLQSVIFAKQPAVNVGPSEMTQPPPQKKVLAMAIQDVTAQKQQVQASQQQAAQAGMQIAQHLDPAQVAALADAGRKKLIEQGAGQPGQPPLPPPPNPNGDPAAPPGPIQLADNDPDVLSRLQQLMAPYQQKRDDAKQFAETMEIVITKLWQQATLKKVGEAVTRSALSVGVGWFKMFWQERMGQDPVIQQQLHDLQEKMAQIQATQQCITDPDYQGDTDEDAEKAYLEQQIEGLQANIDVIVARGLVCYVVEPEDMQVSIDAPSITDYKDAAWVAERSFFNAERIKADFPDIADRLKSATPYYAVKPRNTIQQDTGNVAAQGTGNGFASNGYGGTVEASEADRYVKNQNSTSPTDNSEPFYCVWEAWDRTSSNVITLIEGLKDYAKPPYVPAIGSTRGNPYFLLAVGVINGSRHPRSLISRSASLFDEYNAARTNWRTARQRAIPKTGYDKTNMQEADVDALSNGTIGEMIGLTPIKAGTPIKDMLQPIAYNQIDAALFQTAPIEAELEKIWGVQQALMSSVQVAKTATEAEIQESGTKSRTGYIGDLIDAVFDDCAIYTSEISIQALKPEDVEEMAGPWALWPQDMPAQEMQQLLTVNIDAGSSGKPKTAQQQQAWAMIAPVLAQNIKEIGSLRGSSNDEVADCLEQLVQETINRAGDRIDASQFLPDPPRVPPPPLPGPPPPPLQNSALNGVQVAELLATLNEVRAGAMAPQAATILITQSYQAFDPEQIAQMVQASLPVAGQVPAQSKFAPPPAPPIPPGSGNMPNASPSPTASEGTLQ